MYLAIRNLLDEPQNNLKIFRVSLCVHTHESSCGTMTWLSSTTLLFWMIATQHNAVHIRQDGELIYGGMDDAEQQHDLNKLTQQLRSYFFPTNMLIQDPPSNKAMLNKLSQVIITALLTSWDAEGPTQPTRDYVPVGRDQCHASLPLLDCLKGEGPGFERASALI